MHDYVFLGFCCLLLSGSAAPALWTGLRVEQPSYSYEGCYDYTISGTIRPTSGGNVYVQGLLYGHEENDGFFLKSYDYSETVAPVQCAWFLVAYGDVLGPDTVCSALPIELTGYGAENEGGTSVSDRGDFYLGFLAERAWTESDEAWYGWVHVSVDSDFQMHMLGEGIELNGGAVVVGGTPEPSGGLLLLLGTAILALRRKKPIDVSWCFAIV